MKVSAQTTEPTFKVGKLFVRVKHGDDFPVSIDDGYEGIAIRKDELSEIAAVLKQVSDEAKTG